MTTYRTADGPTCNVRGVYFQLDYRTGNVEHARIDDPARFAEHYPQYDATDAQALALIQRDYAAADVLREIDRATTAWEREMAESDAADEAYLRSLEG